LGVFLLLFLPSVVLSFFVSGETATTSFPVIALSTIFRLLALVALILFFLWRNGESDEKIGWTTHAWGTNALLGVALFPPIFIGAAILSSVLQSLGLSGPDPASQGFLIPGDATEMVLALLLVAIVAVGEETVFRGYLIVRLEALFRSPAVAVVLSSVIFALGHGYEGVAGVITVGMMGFALALVFLWTRSLVAPTIIHFLNNFVAILLVPLLV